MTNLNQPYFIKICGVTTLGDANAAIEAGANSIGLILAASPRRLTLDRALAIATASKDRVLRTLVFRDADDGSILEALDLIDADLVQIHGPASESLLAELGARSVSVIKALSISSDEFADFDDRLVDAVLIDGASPGSGVFHSWDELSDRTFTAPVIAAGGLDDSNVAGVIARTGVWGVDVASGVESAPGVKDRERMSMFATRARAAFDERTMT